MRPLLPLLISLLGAAPLAAQDVETVVIGERLVLSPGNELRGSEARMLIRGGQVQAVGASAVSTADASRVVRLAGTIVPGFVQPHSYLDLEADLAETIDAFTPELRAAEAFDPFDESLQTLARGGVTSVGLAPSSRNTFAGSGAVVQWNGDEGVLTSEETYLKLSLVPASLNRERFPTSRMGASELIRTELQVATQPLAGSAPEYRVLKDLLGGSRTALVHANSHAEISAALDLCEEFALVPMILGGDELGESMDRLRGSSVSVMLSPLGWGSDAEQLELPARLAAEGVSFSFTADDPNHLRLSAALAIRNGLAPDVALAALTVVPAQQCGLEEPAGTLLPSARADFAVFSGDPLDLGSRLMAVYVAGRPLNVSTPKGETR